MRSQRSRQKPYGKLSPPITALEWARAISDPESLVGKDFLHMIRSIIIEEDLGEFVKELVNVRVFRQKRADEELRAKVVYKHELETARLLESWNKPAEEEVVVPSKNETSGFFIDLVDLGYKANEFGKYIGELLIAQQELHVRWEVLHRQLAKNMLKYIKHSKLPLIGVNGEDIELTALKQQQFEEALMPAPIAAFCRMNPDIGNAILNAPNQKPNLVCENIAKTMNIMKQIRALSLLHNNADPEFRLTGPDLLKVLKNNPLAFNAREMGLVREGDENSKMLFVDANISMGLKAASDHVDQNKNQMLQDLHLMNRVPFVNRPRILPNSKKMDEEEMLYRRSTRSA